MLLFGVLRLSHLGNFQAVLRFGSPSEPLERGEPVPGTYCSRIFYECSKKRCRLQSPNFPGMYPRNITCHLSLRQKDVPTCKHAMIAVKQENSYKIQIKVSDHEGEITRDPKVPWSPTNISSPRKQRLWKKVVNFMFVALPLSLTFFCARVNAGTRQ